MITLLQKKIPKKIPLRLVLIIPFATIIILTVSLTGYIAFTNGQKAVNDAAHRIRSEISARIQDHLRAFLSVPHQINEFNAASLQQGWSDPKDEKMLQAYFLEQVKNHNTITSLYFGNADGGIIGGGREGAEGTFYVYATEGLQAGTFNKYAVTQSGETGELLASIPKFDARTRPWYTGAEQRGAAGWNNIYIIFTGQDMAISASSPIYDRQHTLLGVVSVDIFLSQIENFLQSIKISESGQSFIMEPSGLLVGTSTGERPFTEKDGKFERLDARNSQSPVIKSSADFLYEYFDGNYDIDHEEQLEFSIDGKRYFLTVSPVHDPYGIDWLVVVVIPESDFTAEIAATNRSTAVITILALAVSILVSVFVSQKISSRVSHLNESIRALARGEDGHLETSNSRISEIDELAMSFMEMGKQLSQMLNDLRLEVSERKKIDQTLHESESLFRAIFEQAAVGIAQVAPDGRWLNFNQRLCDILGYTQDELLKMSFQELTHPDDLETDVANMHRLLADEIKIYSREKRYVRKDKGSVWANLTVSLMRDPAGAPKYFISVIEDVSSRKQAHQALQESEQRYKMVSELASDYIYKVGVAADGKISLEFVTDKYYAITGRSLEEGGKLEAWSSIFHPDDLGKVMVFLQTLIAARQPGTIECRTYLASGQMRWVEIMARSEWDESENRVTAIIGAVKDITERKHAEEALQVSEARYRQAIVAAGAVPYYRNYQGDEQAYAFMGEGILQLTGYTAAEITPAIFDQLEQECTMRGSLAHLTPDEAGRLSESGEIQHWASDYRIVTRDGQTRWISDSAIQVRDEHKRRLGVIGILQDITERKQVEEALRESEDKFKYVFDYSMVGKSITNPGGEVNVNKALCDMLGYSTEEMQGKKWQEITHPDDIELTQKNIDLLVLGEKESARFIKRFIHKNSSIVWVDLSSTIRRNQQKKPLYLMTAVIDITERKQAEEALQKSEVLYRQAIEVAGAVPYLQSYSDMGTGVGYEFIGEGIRRITGYGPEEFNDKLWDSLTEEKVLLEDLAEYSWSEAIRRVRSGKNPIWKCEHRIRARDGKIHWVFESAVEVRDESGVAHGSIGLFQDITERKRAEVMREVLLEVTQGIVTTKELRDFLSLVHRSIAKIIYAENFFVNLYNKDTGFFEEAYSVDKFDPPGTPPARLEKSLSAYVFRSGKPFLSTTEAFNELVERGEVELVGAISPSWLGVPLKTAGETIGVIVVQDYDTPDRYSEHDVEILVSIASQVGLAVERKRAEEVLRESKERFESIIEASGVGSWDWNIQTGENILNERWAEIVGYSLEELAPISIQTWLDLIHPDDLKQSNILLKKHFNRETEVYQHESRLKHKNGQWVWVLDRGKVLTRDADGKSLRMLGTHTDITERKRAEEEIRKLNAELEQRVRDRTLQLETANKELEAFSYSISHDLRAPLRGIDGWSQALLEDYNDKLDEQGKQYIDRVRSEAQRMGHLIEDMLQLSRLTRAEMSKTQVDLGALAHTIIERLKREEPQRKVEFDIQENLTAKGDPHLLESVLTNLLGNAFKFTGRVANARIEFGQVKKEGKRAFFVRDNGAGFDMAHAEKLFGAFQRMHKASEFPGTGIGLAIVQRVIHRHGGKVWAEAKLNEGATFYFIIPE